MANGILKSSHRSRTLHSSGAAYADIEAATRGTLSADAGSSGDEHDQFLGNGNGDGSYHHGGSGDSLQGGSDSHSYGGNGHGLVGQGRHYSDELGDSDGGDGGSGTLQWEADEQPDGSQQQQHAWRLLWGRSASSVALICLLLTLGSFLVPESEEGIGLIMKHVHSASTAAREDAIHHGKVFVKRLRGERHCRPPPRLLRKNATEKVHIAGMGEQYEMQPPQDRSQPWLVNARKDGLLSIMTPVYPDNETMALLHNQLRSANKFLRMDSIREWILIAPEAKVPMLVHYLENKLAHLPCVLVSKMRVVSDESCVPELRPEQFEQITGDMRFGVSGWIKQQLIKLACSFTIQTPYFLITDSDTFFTNRWQALDLMLQKDCNATSGVCDLKRKVQFKALNELQPPSVSGDQLEWITSSARVLNITEPRGNEYMMGVTPQIMSRAVLDPMARYMEANVTRPGETWRAYLLRMEADRLRDEEKKALPAWTEYDLYWEYALYAKIWRKYHSYAILQRAEANLWTKAQYEDWEPCDEVDMERHRGYWAVVQSTLHLGADLIWKKLAPCMDHDSI